MTVKGAIISTTIASLSLMLTSSEHKPIVHQKLIVLEAPPKVLTTKEVIEKTPLYHDLNRVEWLLNETEKELQRQNAISKRFTQDTAGEIQPQVGDNHHNIRWSDSNRVVHSIQ